jgi:hypothetical protein
MPYGSTLRGILGGQSFANVRAVVFDGANDYLTRGDDYTGAADSKKWTLSFQIKDISAAGNLIADRDANYLVSISSSSLTIQAKSSSTIRLQVIHPFAFSSGVWNRIEFSVDLSDSNKRHLKINGNMQSPTWTSYTNTTMDFTQADHYVGANRASGSPQDWLNAELAELWCGFGQYIDLSDPVNSYKFHTAAGKPANLGDDGSAPTGTAPTVYLSVRDGDTASDFATNRGTGGGMTENGALALAATSPSD